MNEYMLATGKSADYRLKILNKIIGRHSKKFLVKKALKEGMHIAEIGCGTGNMLQWLSKKVGAHGKIYAIDSSEEQLNVAAKKAALLNLPNIEFILDDAHKLSKLNIKLDLVYSRLLLLHLQKPLIALKRMKNILKKNGFLVVEEMSMNTGICFPYSEHYVKSRLLFKNLAAIKGLDFDIALKLSPILSALHFRIVDTKWVRPILCSPDERKMLWLSIEESAHHFVTHNLSSFSEIEILSSKLKEMSYDKKLMITLPRLTQICARKL